MKDTFNCRDTRTCSMLWKRCRILATAPRISKQQTGEKEVREMLLAKRSA